MPVQQVLYRSHDIMTSFEVAVPNNDLQANLSLDYTYSSSDSEDNTSLCSSTEEESEDSFDNDAQKETDRRLRSLRRKFRMKRKHHLQTIRTHKATRTKSSVTLTDDLLNSWLHHTSFPHQNESGIKRSRSMKSRTFRHQSENSTVFRRHRSLDSVNTNRKHSSQRRSPSCSYHRDGRMTLKSKESYSNNDLCEMWTLQRRDAFDLGDDEKILTRENTEGTKHTHSLSYKHNKDKDDVNTLEPLFTRKLVLHKQLGCRKPPLPPAISQQNV